MTRTNLSMSISADGYVAGPNQSKDHPLGVGGRALHEWHLGPTKDHPANLQVISDMMDGIGATIMGRNMFGPIRGEWGNSDWKGWWGEVPPYRCPVFVLTHHAREKIEMEGGTTFHFVTDGIESAYAQAKAAAGDQAISIGGGASCARQAIAAGLVDEIDLQVNPAILVRRAPIRRLRGGEAQA
jgi:dihydrofolate reductase